MMTNLQRGGVLPKPTQQQVKHLTRDEREILKEKWKKHWIGHARALSGMSPCPRGIVGALIIDPRNNIVASGFNGGPRGAIGELCGGEFCERSKRGILSGQQVEIGCHHAELNAIANAAAKGVSTDGCSLVCSVSPCLACAKLIHHAGIVEVITAANYDPRGATYLRAVGVTVEVVEAVEG